MGPGAFAEPREEAWEEGFVHQRELSESLSESREPIAVFAAEPESGLRDPPCPPAETRAEA